MVKPTHYWRAAHLYDEPPRNVQTMNLCLTYNTKWVYIRKQENVCARLEYTAQIYDSRRDEAPEYASHSGNAIDWCPSREYLQTCAQALPSIGSTP